MNRKGKILLASYGAAAVFTAAGLIFANAGGAEGFRRSQDNEYRRAMARLVGSVSQMDDALARGQYAVGSAMTGRLCAELMSGARSASTALSILPLETYALEELGEFLSQMEEYARVKGEQACSGSGFGRADRENARRLQEVTGALVPVLGDLYYHVTEGGLSIRGLLQPAGRVTDMEDSYLEDEILSLLESLPDAPALLYEGTLSDDYDDSYRGLAGLGSVTEEEALAAAEKLAGDTALEPMGVSYGEVPCYYFGGVNDHGTLTVTVTRQGGLPMLYLQEYSPDGEGVSEEEVESAAAAFLEQAGYGELRLYDSRDVDGLLKLRYVYSDDLAAHPDDGVEMTVALDSGAVVAMDASDFLRYHDSGGSGEAPAMTAEEAARASVPDGLTVEEEQLTWFTKDTGASVLCRRFVCADSQGQRCTIYADANTGAQVEIRTEDENMSEM